MHPRTLLLLLSLQGGHGLVCYFCSKEGMERDGTCGNQWQLDCGTLWGNRRPPDDRMLCRTSLMRGSANSSYSIEKECVSAEQHRQDFPGGRMVGCDKLMDDTGFEVTYCVCQSDRCNGPSMSHQITHQEKPSVVPSQDVGVGGPIMAPPMPSAYPSPVGSQYPGVEYPTGHSHYPVETQPPPAFDPVPPRGPSTAFNPFQPEPLSLNTRDQGVERWQGGVEMSTDFQQLYQQQSVENILGKAPPAFPTPDPYPRQRQLPVWTNAPELSAVAELEPAMRFQPNEPVPIAKLFEGYEEAWVPAEEESVVPPPRTPFSDTTPFAPIQTDNDLHVRRAFFGEQPTAGSVQGLVCLVCREESEDGGGVGGTGCAEQRAMDCSAQYPPGTPTYCFTRDSHLSSGTHVVEKLCVSDYALEVEYGQGAAREGCSSVWGGRVHYCVCAADKCNENSVFAQMGNTSEPAQAVLNVPASLPVAPPSVQSPYAPGPFYDLPPAPQEPAQPQPGATAPAPSDKPGQKCFVCGESNLVNTTDCAQSYEYDCGLQYPGLPDVLCLTRLTKLEHDMVAVEKRCITEAQHREQYPGNDVVVDGCGAAWDGYVQYCVCRDPLCNKGGLDDQKPDTVSPPSSTLPPDHSYLQNDAHPPPTHPPTTTTFAPLRPVHNLPTPATTTHAPVTAPPTRRMIRPTTAAVTHPPAAAEGVREGQQGKEVAAPISSAATLLPPLLLLAALL